MAQLGLGLGLGYSPESNEEQEVEDGGQHGDKPPGEQGSEAVDDEYSKVENNRTKRQEHSSPLYRTFKNIHMKRYSGKVLCLNIT